MKKIKWWKALFVLPFIPIIFYIPGYISQFIINYRQWQAGGEVGNPSFPSYMPQDCIKAVMTFPYGVVTLGICVILLIILLIKMRGDDGDVVDRDRNLLYSGKGTYGTSGYMTPEERNRVLEITKPADTDGTILGRIRNKAVSLPIKSRMNRNIAVYGASGSMKSRAFARNMILQAAKRGESIVVTDPKSELYEDMSRYLAERRYTVRVFNLVNPQNSDSWNCLSEIEGSELMAQVLTDVIIKNTGNGKSDPFWDSSEMALLKALVLYVTLEYPEDQRNMGEVYKLISMSSEASLSKLFSPLPLSHPAKAPYSIFRQAADSVRGGVIIGLGARIQVFQNRLICDMTSCKDIDLELPGHEKCAYFCITSDQDSTFDFLSSLFFSFLFIKLVRYADKNCPGGKLPIPVTCVLDEFPNIGSIPDFCKKISTIRSRNISVSVIFQNLAQLQNRYPNNQWQEILGNCDTQLFLGCTDEVTAKFISDRTGEVTIGVSSQARQVTGWTMGTASADYRETSSIGKRKLLTMDEVLRMPIDEELIILRGQKVLRVSKFDYTLHPEAKHLIPCKASEHIPARNKRQMNHEAKKEVMSTCTSSEHNIPSEPMEVPNQPETPENPGNAKPGIEEIDLNNILSGGN